MDTSTRKEIKSSFRQGLKSNLIRHQPTVLKKYSLKPTPIDENSFPTYVVPRIPTEKEIAENAVRYGILCTICATPCIDDYIRCRVCIKIYHSQCLYGPDDVNDELNFSPRLEKDDKSCPECEDLTRLLTQDEINYLTSTFEQIDLNKDGFILMKDFLEFCSKEKMTEGWNLFTRSNLDLEKVYFNLMDSSQQGNVSWSEFLRFYSCKLIAAKNKTQLTTKLSKKELIFAKRLFLKDPCLKIDHKRKVIITKNHFNQVSYDLMLTIKKKYGGDYIDAILHENQNIDETIEEPSVIGWDDYLHRISIPILLNRSNYELKDSQLHRGSMTRHLSGAIVDSPDIDLTKNVTMTSLDLTFDKSFRKYGKILEKLNKQEKLCSLVDYSIVENTEEQGKFELPKLKINARDGRQTISEPWSVVKDMEHLRNQPILVTTTHIKMFKF